MFQIAVKDINYGIKQSMQGVRKLKVQTLIGSTNTKNNDFLKNK